MVLQGSLRKALSFMRQTSTRDDGAAEGRLVVGTGLFAFTADVSRQKGENSKRSEVVYPTKIREQDHIHFVGEKGEVLVQDCIDRSIRKKENKKQILASTCTHVGCELGSLLGSILVLDDGAFDGDALGAAEGDWLGVSVGSSIEYVILSPSRLSA